jgi:ankyrin
LEAKSLRQKVLLGILAIGVAGLGLFFWTKDKPGAASRKSPASGNAAYQGGETDPKWTALHLAARDGDDAKLAKLLAGSSPPGPEDSYGRTPLHLAAQEGRLAAAKVLIEHQASLAAADRWGNTPLHWAVRANHPDVVGFLLDQGADINAKNVSGDAPLHVAALYGNTQTITILVQHGAPVNVMSEHFYSPLTLAEAAHKTEAEELLRQNGANEIRRPATLKFSTDPKAWGNKWADCPICAAVVVGDLDQVKAILKKDKPAINARDDRQNTPLHLAAWSGRVEIAKYLLDQGADLAAKNKSGDPPLSCAANNNWVEVMEVMLAHGANIEAPNSWGYTPMHFTGYDDAPEAVIFLADHGAKVDADPGSGNGKGWTPLIVAAREGALLSGQAMLQRGANIETRTANQNRTPLVMALQYGQPEFADFLLAKGAVPLPPAYPIPGAYRGHGGPPKVSVSPEDLKARLEKGEDVNTKDDKGRSLLYLAAADGNREAVELLLTKGAEINLITNTGKTPLHIAVINDHIAVAGLLLKKGADPNQKDKDGNTPMDYARSLKRDGFVELLHKYKGE